MRIKEEISYEEANSFLSRKLLKNSWHHFEESQQGNLERECIEEACSFEEAREVFETDVNGLNQFWAQYTGQTSSSSQDNPVGLIIGILFGVVGFFVLLLIVYVLWKKRNGDFDRKMKESVQTYNPYPILSFYAARNANPSNHYETPLLDSFDNELAMGLSKCYLERERLKLGEVITSGNFGDVWKGQLRNRDNTWSNVAVKSLKTLNEPADIEKFLREGVMMRGLDHDNVLSLIGVCVDAEIEKNQTSPLIVLPFMDNGDLRTFLRDGNNVLTVLHLLKFCSQIARGMAYLSRMKFVHRDLAARNCMVDNNWTVKVADFGLSRDLFDRDYYKSSVKTQLPLKWMPPESIQYGRYGEKSDVWSYGITMWEVMTRGAIPYPTIQAVDILQYLSEGNRMDRPECCPHKLHKAMKKCWNDDPDLRPSFEDLVDISTNIVKDARRSVRRRSRSSDAPSSVVGNGSRSSNLYQNSVKDYGNRGNGDREREKSKPKPKPRTSLKLKSNERLDKYAPREEGEKSGRREKREGGKLKGRENLSSPVDSNMVEMEVSVYNDTNENGQSVTTV